MFPFQLRNCPRMNKPRDRGAAPRAGDWQKATRAPRRQETAASDGTRLQVECCSTVMMREDWKVQPHSSDIYV